MLHHYINGKFLLAGFGNVMFFVLSGYFGTYGLLKLRTKARSGAFSLRKAFGMFYQRRYSRIFPLHYLVLVCSALAGIAYSRKEFLWNACFVSNFAMWHQGEWFGRFSPLWSISVLEQFYLVWPALMFFTPRRALIPVCIGGASMAVGWRLFCVYAGLDAMAYVVVPFTGLDQLCAGGLLAICKSEYVSKIAAERFLGVGRFAAVLFVALLAGRAAGVEPPYCSLYISLIAAVAFAWLTNRCREGFGGITGKILSNPLLAHCGRLSYAAFLLHNFTELLLPRSPHVRDLMATNYRCLLLVPATFFIADLFWRFFENPLLRLRENGSLLKELWCNPRAVRTSFAAPFIELRQNITQAIRSLTSAVRTTLLSFPEMPAE